MKKYVRIIISSILIFVFILPLASCSDNQKATTERITIKLVAPQNAFIEDFDSNLYKLWLEEQTNLNIEMTWLPERDAEQIVKLALASGEDLPDAYVGFGSTRFELFQQPNIQFYGEQGVIIPLNDLIEQYGVHTKNC